MAFTRPTLLELVDRIEQDFVSRLELSGSLLRRSVTRVLARVHAGAAHMLHGHLEYLSLQLFPDLSDEAYLIRQASTYGLFKTAATAATASVTFTGTLDGAVIDAGTVLLRADGVTYTVDADATIASGTVTADITAELAGADGTLTASVSLTFEYPVATVTSTATVAATIADGTDQETTDALRVRLLERMRAPAHGGSDADYVAWAKAVSGVTRAWVYPRGLGAGTVVVRFLRDNDVSPIPDAGEVAAVQAYIDDLAPVTAIVTVVAPAALVRNFTLSITPDTSDTRAAVGAELTDLLLREGAPGATLYLSQIRTAIGIAEGITDYTLTSPAADVTHTANQVPTMGTVTWV